MKFKGPNVKVIEIKPKHDGHQTTKAILYWNSFFDDPGFKFGLGQKPFVKYKCPVYDCFTTTDRSWTQMEHFDAIVFHGAEYDPFFMSDYPSRRSNHQLYVYLSKESPLNRPVKSNLNDFFNRTMTHRLDSDVVANYFSISDLDGFRIAPSDNPKWMTPDFANLLKYVEVNREKKIPAAWFVSNCESQNNREKYVYELQKYIQVDVYGSCGPFKCSRNNEQHCFDLLRTNYYFYLSFENSNCQDYVTEKVSNALENNVVPIVLGGANYTRFLPPHSYIDASGTSPKDLAQMIKNFIDNPKYYAEYFWWKNYYQVVDGYNPFCKLCEILHERNVRSKSYNIREWWHGPSSKPICR